MLRIDTKLVLNREAIRAPNLCDRFDKEDLARIGGAVLEGYQRDKLSRAAWERRTEAAMDLAMQVQTAKSFPWPNCSNIAFPLVTIAALQFHSRAYPALIDGPQVVKMRTFGEDPQGEKRARADRVSTFMSWQCLEQDCCWEEQHDRLLINVPIVGVAWIKSYYDPRQRHETSELVLARDFVVDYWAKSTELAPRKTHIIPLFRNDIHERMGRDIYRDVSAEGWYNSPATPQATAQAASRDRRTGQRPPQADEQTPYIGLEQHVLMDLDQDGYAEPYIITIEEQSRAVLRIVTGFDREEDVEKVEFGPRKGKVVAVRQMQYFTKYGLIPSPDGGIYDVGFGSLLGPLNESVNTGINQIFDANTMNVTAGGFLARSVKIRGGNYSFSPNEWKRTDSSPEDLKNGIVPYPAREPSSVMFQLLVLLINYTNRISGSTDTLVGENPGQNQPYETTKLVADQGLKIYSAIFKRMWRSMKEEFKKRYISNGIHLPVGTSYFGDRKQVMRDDFLGNPDEIAPAADPNLSSEQMQIQQAQLMKQDSMQSTGYDRDAVTRRYLRAMKVDNIEEVFPGSDKVPQGKDPKVQIQEMKTQEKMAALQQANQQFVAELLETVRMNNAEIVRKQAETMKLLADAANDKAQTQIAAINAQIGAMKHHNDALLGHIDRILAAMELESGGKSDGESDGGGAPARGATGRVLSLAGASGNPASDAGASALAGAGA